MFTGLSFVVVILILNLAPIFIREFYSICLLLGLTSRYWALFVTMVTEQFGTNVRATVSTKVPNFVRGAVVPMMIVFNSTLSMTGSILLSAGIVGAMCYALVLWGVIGLKETFAQDLDYLEK